MTSFRKLGNERENGQLNNWNLAATAPSRMPRSTCLTGGGCILFELC